MTDSRSKLTDDDYHIVLDISEEKVQPTVLEDKEKRLMNEIERIYQKITHTPWLWIKAKKMLKRPDVWRRLASPISMLVSAITSGILFKKWKDYDHLADNLE